jgi:NAD(P)-dependent dehydrogenase (short-subunit alcohol dehydrogenase family)
MTSPALVALVTASSAGLGASIVQTLSPHFRCVVNYHSRKPKADEVVSLASKTTPTYAEVSPRFHIIQADVSKRSEIERLVSETVSTMGRLDLVVSNGGWTRITNFNDLEQQVNEEDWDRCFNVNVKSHLWLLYAAKPHLSKSPGGGGFITIASLAGVRPSGSSLPYSVTKAAEIHLTKGLATICGKEVRCNSISPGLMMTEWGEKFGEEKVKATTQKGALKRLAEVKDVAEMVKSVAMNGSVTGQNFVVDCGIAI